MECPRCAATLVQYSLDGREAVVCESCGFIGVPVEHRGEYREVESWDDAVSRVDESARGRGVRVQTASGDPTRMVFESTGDGDAGPTVVRLDGDVSLPEPTREGSPGLDADDGGQDGDGRPDGDDVPDSGVTCDVCGKAFDTRAQLNGHMAVHAG